MPTIDWNQQTWDGSYDWGRRGEEWSGAWGGPDAQWHRTLQPRLGALLPAGLVVEIAPGFGRWTTYLLEHCDRYVGIDLSESCIETCRKRFAAHAKATFTVNDGRSLPTVGDGEVDLAFSFDSLVHVEADVLAAYLRELARVLAADGVAFLHHSNLGAYAHQLARRDRTPQRLQPMMQRRGILVRSHHRDPSVTAVRFVELCRAAGLRCFSQELVNWGDPRMIDCISVVGRPGSRYERPNMIVENPDFMAEARSIERSSRLSLG